MVTRDELNHYLNNLLQPHRVKDYCPNGLQIAGKHEIRTLVTGVTANQELIDNACFLKADALLVHHGFFWKNEDVKNATKVCILGQTVVINLFGDLDPLGKIIRIKGIPFKVIGTLERKGQSMVGQDQDDGIYIPLTTGQKKLFGSEFPGMVRIIMVKANNAEALSTSEEEITALLKEKHHIGLKQEDDFSIRNLTQMMQMAQQASNVMALLLGAIASISLLVGGIGIMNIMLVSVTERTKEIGIRMAIGAKTWDIRLQFLIEALMLSLSGGIVGILIGILGANLISSAAGWPTMVSPLSIILSFGFSGVVGIFFGFYPAYKASLLSPIDALRYE